MEAQHQDQVTEINSHNTEQNNCKGSNACHYKFGAVM